MVSLFTFGSSCLFSFFEARPCDIDGIFEEQGANAPTPFPERNNHDWSPFDSRSQFEFADLLYSKAELSSAETNRLLEIWQAWSLESEGHTDAPFKSHRDLLATVDAITYAEASANWKSFSVSYDGEVPEDNPPKWMTDEYAVYYRDPHEVVQNMLADADFADEFDYVPYREYKGAGNRIYGNYMSGDLANKYAVCISSIFVS